MSTYRGMTLKPGFSLTPVGTFLVLLGLAVCLPMYHDQMVTGPLINAMLFIAATMAGLETAVFLGLIPSVVALSAGLLPPVLAPMIPFIMVSNALMIMAFGLFKDRNFILGILVASIVKFLFLYSTSSLVCSLLLKKDLAQAVLYMMSWPQGITALAGGLLAWGLLKGVHRR